LSASVVNHIIVTDHTILCLTESGQVKVCVVQICANRVSSNLQLGPAADDEPYHQHVSINKIWRRVAITSRGWRWYSQVAGLSSD